MVSITPRVEQLAKLFASRAGREPNTPFVLQFLNAAATMQVIHHPIFSYL
ncbi:MAG: hypothetical protein H6632_15015 [Anaerolineales bacterium]|nr:hypothetical protein [Anaerolineales bacterium]